MLRLMSRSQTTAKGLDHSAMLRSRMASVLDKSSGSLNTSGKLPLITLEEVGYALANISLIAFGPLAIERSRYCCVNNYTATVNNTVLTENLRSSWYNHTSNALLADLSNTVNFTFSDRVFYNTSPPTGGTTTGANVDLTSAELNVLVNDGLTPDDYIVADDPSLGA